MAEFGSGRKNRIPISKDDIKKAIKSANDRLKKANEKLDQGISDKKKSLLSIVKKVDSSSKDLKSIASEVESAKNDAIEAKSESKKERVKLSKLKKQFTEALSGKDSAQSELNNLTKESSILGNKIAKMNDDLAIASTIKEEIKILKSDKKNESKELEQIINEANGIKNELSQLRTDSTKKKKDHKELLSKLDTEIENKQKVLGTVDGKHTIKMAELNTKLSCLRDVIDEKEQEASILESLVKKRELEYIEIESKYKQAENALIFTRDITNKEVEREKKEVQNIKDAFKQWKVAALEEVARLKLKKKIENIDKAGLSEILNG